MEKKLKILENFMFFKHPENYLKHGFSHYFKCMVGGALSCGITHTVLLPIDIVKCKK
jgi:solute carrier family 25 phosphate transporter 3